MTVPLLVFNLSISNMFSDCLQHSIECGAGTGIFLLVSSSIIVVIRGPRATLWGSVYLDEHGEEDRDLKLVFGFYIQIVVPNSCTS